MGDYSTIEWFGWLLLYGDLFIFLICISWFICIIVNEYFEYRTNNKMNAQAERKTAFEKNYSQFEEDCLEVEKW